MEVKIMWAAGIFLFGWLWFYIFGRQFLFNFMTAFPLISRMQKTQKDLIADTAKKYTVISSLVCGLIFAALGFVAFRFLPVYMKISFGAGAVLAVAMYITRLGPDFRNNFDSFCNTYYRFVPDDALRTAMYNKKIPQMKLRLHDMELPLDFIPNKFKDKE